MYMFPEMGRVIIVALMIVIPVCLIYRKAGFHPAWGLLVLLPGFGLLIIFMMLGLLPWPNQKDSEENS